MIKFQIAKDVDLNHKHSFLKAIFKFGNIRRTISDSPETPENNKTSSNAVKNQLDESKQTRKVFGIKRSRSDPPRKENNKKENQKTSLKKKTELQPQRKEIQTNKNDNKPKRLIQISKPIQKVLPIQRPDSKNVIKIDKPNPSKKISFITKDQANIKNTPVTKPTATKTQIAQKKTYNIMMPIENEPVCIAIGDIEGDYDKLKLICNFIKMNPQLSFVFIGDIIDDISDGKNCEVNWSCISLICNELLTNDDMIYRLDNKLYFDTKDQDKSKIVSLPSGFRKIEFEEKNFDDIKNRVKFIAGNSECHCLSDFQKGYKKIDNKFIFGEKEYAKTVTFEQMCLLHRFLSNFCGVITLKTNHPSNSDKFKKTVYFRHWIHKFSEERIPSKMLHQETGITLKDIQKQNFIFITGHTRLFMSAGPKEAENQEMYYFIDSTSFKKEYTFDKKFPNEIRGLGSNDYRLALITFNDVTGFSVECISLPNKIAKSHFRYGIDQIC